MHSKNQAKKKSLAELAIKKQFIPGICNFCNRWCERCSKTQRCLSFAHEHVSKGIDIEENNNDLENKKFWNTIEQTIKADATELIQNSSSFVSPEHTTLNIVTFAETYETDVNIWLKENKDILKERANLNVANYDSDKIILLSNSIEIIKCYKTFISKRITRSLKDLSERKDHNFNDPGNPFKDNIGSAKNTIIACNHSIAAFSLLYPKLENHREKIQSFISNLIQIKNHVLEIFPKATQFKRPGFDD